MSKYFPEPKSLGGRVKVELDLSNYGIKADFKKCCSFWYIKNFAKNVDLANLKSSVGKLYINKLKNVPSNLNNLKSKVNKSDVNNLVPVDLSKLIDLVKSDVVKKDVYNAKVKNIEDKISDISNLATETTLNAKINEVKGETLSITNLATTSAFTAVENKITMLVI